MCIRDRYEELSPSTFAFTETGTTLALMLAPADAAAAGAKPDISTYAFKSEYDRSGMYKDFLEFIFKKISTRVIDQTVTEQNTAPIIQGKNELKNNQLKLVVDEIGKINIPKVRQDHEAGLVQKAKDDMLGQNFLGARLRTKIIQCPKLGEANLLAADDLKNLNIYINNVPYGSDKATKPLSAYLEFTAGIISDRYNQDAAYSILLHCLTGQARQMTATAKKKNKDFENHWSKLQCCFDSKQSIDQVNNRIRSICNERPTHLGNTFAKLLNLIEMKYDDDEGDTEEQKNVLIEKEIKITYFKVMKAWYPYKEPIVQQRYSNVVQHAKVYGYTPRQASDLILYLAMEVIGRTPAIHRRSGSAQVFSLDTGPEGMLTEEFLDTPEEEQSSEDIFEASAAVAPDQAEVNAYRTNQRRPNPPNRGRPYSGPPSNQGGPKFRNPESLRKRCLRCSSKNHAAKYCNVYTDPRLSATQCRYCRGLHFGACANLGHNTQQGQVHEFSTSAEAAPDMTEEYDDSNEMYVAETHSPQLQNNDQ